MPTREKIGDSETERERERERKRDLPGFNFDVCQPMHSTGMGVGGGMGKQDHFHGHLHRQQGSIQPFHFQCRSLDFLLAAHPGAGATVYLAFHAAVITITPGALPGLIPYSTGHARARVILVHYGSETFN